MINKSYKMKYEVSIQQCNNNKLNAKNNNINSNNNKNNKRKAHDCRLKLEPQQLTS